jgi:hypothetical protein
MKPVRAPLAFPVSIFLVIAFVAFYPGLVLLKYPEVEIEGTVMSLGSGHVLLVNETDGISTIFLLGKVEPGLEGYTIVAEGRFIPDYRRYLLESFRPAANGDPTGPVLVLKSVERLGKW